MLRSRKLFLTFFSTRLTSTAMSAKDQKSLVHRVFHDLCRCAEER